MTLYFYHTGMVAFAAADFNAYPKFNSYGIVLVSISVVADAFLPNVQERVFDQGSSRPEATFYTNTMALVIMTCMMLWTGDLQVSYVSRIILS